MPVLPILFLIVTQTTLVLRSGDRFAVDDGVVREEKGVVTFRSGGTLYSLPASEIDRTVNEPEPIVVRGDEEPRLRLAVTDEKRKQLLAELEKNHSGTPTPPSVVLASPREPIDLDPDLNREDEWSWRRQARAHEEAIRRANEELQLLETRVKELESKIRTLINLGFKPRSFTYDTALLVRTEEAIPYARLEVERATRAFEEFREEARRRGILPGWLR